MKTELQLGMRSRRNVWTDAHIAPEMLKAHLEFDNDVASRNRVTMAWTVEWICGEIAGGCRIVDLGCGPGLYAERFAMRGFCVTGVDISPNSLRHARLVAKWQGLAIDYRRGSYLRAVPGEHDVATCIYCDFGALLPAEQRAFLRNVHAALAPGGLLFFDVFKAGIEATKRVGRHWSYHAQGGFWSAGAYYLLEETRHFPEACAWGYRAIVLDAKGGVSKEYIIWDHYFSAESIAALLREHGFVVEAIREDLVAANDFCSNAVMFIKARKK